MALPPRAPLNTTEPEYLTNAELDAIIAGAKARELDALRAGTWVAPVDSVGQANLKKIMLNDKARREQEAYFKELTELYTKEQLDNFIKVGWLPPIDRVGQANLTQAKLNAAFLYKQNTYVDELKRQYEGISRDRERIFSVKDIGLLRTAELMGYGMWRLKTNPMYLAISTEKPKLDDIIQQFITKISNSKYILNRVIEDIERLKGEYVLYLYDDLLQALRSLDKTTTGGKRTHITRKKLNKRRRKYTRK